MSVDAPASVKSMRDSYVQIMKALGDPTRLDMVRLIGRADGYPCTSLEDELPVGKSTISYHVKVLRQADLLAVRKSGRFFFYTLRQDVLDFYAPGILDRLMADVDAALPTA